MGLPFFESSRFEFVSRLEGQWETIRSELMALKHEHFVPWPETSLYKHGWDVFGLYAFGKKLDKNCSLCPQTASLVAAVPGMVTAGFSSLMSGAHIAPHRGYTSAVLRYHLGVLVPEPERCTLRVADETRHWREGESLVFDDTLEHEAWNSGQRTRVVLLVDFARPTI